MLVDKTRIVRQAALSPDQAGRFCAINDEAFPPSERKPCSQLQDDIAKGTRRLFAAYLDDSLVGFALILPNVGRDTDLLEFLAVDHERQGQGIGSRLLEFIGRELAAEARGILAEVESDEAGATDERPTRRRRIQFYLRNGFQFINSPFAYVAPNQAGGENVSMKLLWLGLRGAPPPGRSALEECIAGIYGKCYELPENSPLVQAAHSAFEPRAAG